MVVSGREGYGVQAEEGGARGDGDGRDGGNILAYNGIIIME